MVCRWATVRNEKGPQKRVREKSFGWGLVESRSGFGSEQWAGRDPNIQTLGLDFRFSTLDWRASDFSDVLNIKRRGKRLWVGTEKRATWMFRGVRLGVLLAKRPKIDLFSAFSSAKTTDHPGSPALDHHHRLRGKALFVPTSVLLRPRCSSTHTTSIIRLSTPLSCPIS